MTELGVCLDALNPDGAPEPEALPFGWARLVASDNPLFVSYHNELQAAGIHTAVVLARETYSGALFGIESATATLAGRIRPDLWVIGNEMDAGLLDAPSPASWSMSPQAYASFYWQASSAIWSRQPMATVIMGGFVAGQPDAAVLYLTDLRNRGIRCEGMDVHPYGKDPEAAAALLRAYSAATGLALYVLEWNRPADEIGPYTAALTAAGVVIACWFAWSDGMVDGFGLVDASGAPKPESAIFVENIPNPIPREIPQEDPMALNVGSGLVAYIANKNDHPLRDSDFRKNGDGSTFEETDGTLGTYRASNASGSWECVGPFAVAG